MRDGVVAKLDNGQGCADFMHQHRQKPLLCGTPLRFDPLSLLGCDSLRHTVANQQIVLPRHARQAEQTKKRPIKHQVVSGLVGTARHP